MSVFSEITQRRYYSTPEIWWNRICLWAGIVGRMNQADYRTGPILAWEIACIIWNESDHLKAMPS